MNNFVQKTEYAVYKGVGKPISIEMCALEVNEKKILVKVKSSMFGRALQRALKSGHPQMKPNSALGTLFTGIVVNDNDYIPKGSRVVVNPHKPCGKCDNCRNGKFSLCSANTKIYPGGISQYVLVDGEEAGNIFEFNEKIDFNEAVLTEIVACVLESISKVEKNKDSTFLIAGSGIVAFIHAQLLKKMGYCNVYGLYRKEAKKKVFERIGIKSINDVLTNEEIRTSLRENISDFDGFDVIFEVVGDKKLFAKSLELIASKGKIVLFGGYKIDDISEISLNAIHYKEIGIVGTYHYEPQLFREALDVIENKIVELDYLITNRTKLEKLPRDSDIIDMDSCISLLVNY